MTTLQKSIIGVLLVIGLFPITFAFADHNHGWKRNHWHSKDNHSRHETSQKPIIPTPTPEPTPPNPPSPTPPSLPLPTGGEVTKQIYNTFFGWPDNTPSNSSELSTGGTAGGTGTYQDPITAASGYVIKNGQEVLDFPYGTIFYVQSEQKYFSIQDECGDPPNPDKKACHTILDSAGKGASAQIDLWAGGVGAKKGTSAGNAVEDCEATHTRINTVIFNPSPNYPVTSGEVC